MRGATDRVAGDLVVVPMLRRPARLAACLDALAQQTFPPERFEVIVVDDGSEFPPADVAAGFQVRLDVRFLTQATLGPAAARNAGAGLNEPAADRLEGVSDDNDRQVGSQHLSECTCYPVMRVS